MFVHVTSRIPGRKNDGMLRKVGGRGFPTFVALSSTGEVLAKPRRRSIQAFKNALDEAAEIEAETRADAKANAKADAKTDPKSDGATLAMELLRRVKMGALTDPKKDRADYILARAALNEVQRKQIEEALLVSELTIAQQQGMAAAPGSAASDRAVLAMLAAKEKFGGEWPMIAISNRVLITLMRWAEHNKDPQMYQALFTDFVKVRRKIYGKRKTNESFIKKFEARLDRLWQGKPPSGQRRNVRRRR